MDLSSVNTENLVIESNTSISHERTVAGLTEEQAQKSRRLELEAEIGPLLPGWSFDEIWVDSATVGSSTLKFCGISVKNEKLAFSIAGSSSSYAADPVRKASYEVFERMALMEGMWKPENFTWPLVDLHTGKTIGERGQKDLFQNSPEPDMWQPAKSNGIAAGNTIQDASRRALFELIERHCVLASWYGAYKPSKIEVSIPPELQGVSDVYRIEFFEFGAFSAGLGFESVTSIGAFLWPITDGTLVSYGFAADICDQDAGVRALSEAVQRAGFLQGQTADPEPVFAPNAEYHQEFFLHPNREAMLVKWLNGLHFEESLVKCVSRKGNPVFVNLTPNEDFDGFVVKALLSEVIPLYFGKKPPPQFGNCPSSRLIHPIQ